jgi:hypothetical protein
MDAARALLVFRDDGATPNKPVVQPEFHNVDLEIAGIET